MHTIRGNTSAIVTATNTRARAYVCVLLCVYVKMLVSRRIPSYERYHIANVGESRDKIYVPKEKRGSVRAPLFYLFSFVLDDANVRYSLPRAEQLDDAKR